MIVSLAKNNGGFMSAETAEKKIEKVVIIGSGPAGLTAALYTSRALLSPLMIEGFEAGGQLMTTTDVENFPGFNEGIMGPELIQLQRKQAEKFGTRFITKNVTKVDFSKRPFQISIGKNEVLAESVIISTGASAKYLGIENELKLIGRGVSACATCDGAFFREKHVAVVGGGDSAMEEAMFLTRFASKVTLIHRRDEFRASKIMVDRVLSNPKVEVMWNTQVVDVIGKDQLESLALENTQTKERKNMEFDGLFLAIGHKPNTDLFNGLLETDEVGYLKTKAGSTETSIEGVFAAGDVSDPIYRQAITAAGSGCKAAIDCERWISHK